MVLIQVSRGAAVDAGRQGTFRAGDVGGTADRWAGVGIRDGKGNRGLAGEVGASD